MRKIISLGILLFLLSACTNAFQMVENIGLTGSHPPKAYVEIAGEKYEMMLGTYCWGNTCVDTAGPIDLLADEVPIQLEAGERIQFTLDYEQDPSQTELLLVENEEDLVTIKLKNEAFNAPVEPGIYYYSYVAWWLGKEDKTISHGDAFYAFKFQIK